MAFCTDGWLKSRPKRSRGHWPVPVSLRVRPWSDDWGERNHVKQAIELTNLDGGYRNVYLNQNDMDEVFRDLGRSADHEVRKQAATETLLDLDAEDLEKFLKNLFSRRAAKKQTAEPLHHRTEFQRRA